LTGDEGCFLLAVDGGGKAVPVLKINQQPRDAPHRYRISVSATEIPDRADFSFDIDIEFELIPADGERIRWYLEDYLQFDEEPAPQIANGVEVFMEQCGEELFRKIFEGSAAAIKLWSNLEPHLATTRVEIAAGIAEATAIPWELIRDPNSKTFLALSASAFVRSQHGAQTALPPAAEAAKVRILLVISRPKGGEDVPFRSVAGRLVTRLSDDARDAFDIDVLRPPTYEQLAKTLRLANERVQPYHVVHFDGHGVYADPEDLAGAGQVLSSLKLEAGKTGARGFLMFEDPDSESNGEFVDGFRLGALLKDARVPVLVLNACQSAFVEARPQPETEKPADTREEVEAYGSLAQAVMNAGAAGVVAMRYSVYVVTAAQFVAELYGALARGRQLGEAVTWARKNLHDQPDRQIAYEPRPLQDWSVPVVWERSPLRLWPEKADATPLRISLEDSAPSNPGALDQALPARPDVGFYGRDETLYALDRAFDTHRIVLLHAYAGSGKTSTAAEFARWYALTGGVEGPVLFTSFERHLPLARVLDKIGEVFGDALMASGKEWDAITDLAQRLRIALKILQQIPVLWIWDNVEEVAGFPAGNVSDWSAAEQQELRAFLRAARETKAKFLLTSRRNEKTWLGELPCRVEVPRMPMLEQLELAGAIVSRRGKRLADLPDLMPLLRFTGGNPMTILVTVGAVLRVGVGSKAQLDAFVEALRSGEIDFKDEEAEGRSKSLGASLSYGFSTAFDEKERQTLALLYLFRGFVDVDVLITMSDPDAECSLFALRGLTRESGVVLLDRAVEIGLLNAYGEGCYGIHPVLPWHFQALFEQHFSKESGNADRARRAFIGAMGKLGAYCHDQYNGGQREILGVLAAEEDNLLSAWGLARKFNCWRDVMGTMQSLRTLYSATGREAAWRRLLNEVLPDFVDPATDGPRAGREDHWMHVNESRVFVALEDRNWAEAERLQRLAVKRARIVAQAALELAPESWSELQQHQVRSLAVSVETLGIILREQGNKSCSRLLQEATEYYRSLGAVHEEGVCASNLGDAYLEIDDMRDLDEAERWYRKSLDLHSSGDVLGRAASFGQLGQVARERFVEARAAKRPVEELAQHLGEAANIYHQVLKMIPSTAVRELGAIHNQLGIIYSEAGDVDRALHHYQHDIRYCELAGDVFGAGQTRFNVARALCLIYELPKARAYAEAALANFRSFGAGAADRIRGTERLLDLIDQETGRNPDPESE
jgi:tetratricopeptide (TPR) repeat protein